MPDYTDYRDRFRGERLFVCGNAPSLADDYWRLKDEPFVAACNFIRRWKELPFLPSLYMVTEPHAFDRWFCEEPHMDKHVQGEGIEHRFAFSVKRPEPWDEEWCWIPKTNEIRLSDGFPDPLDAPFRTGANTLMQIGIQFAVYMGFAEIYLLGIELPNGADYPHVYEHVDGKQDSVVALAPEYLTMGYEKCWEDAAWLGTMVKNCTPVGALRNSRIPFVPLEEVL